MENIQNLFNYIINLSVMDIIGYLGTICLIFGYGLLHTKKQTNKNILHTLNLLGCIGVGSNSYYHNAMPGVAINVVWFFLTVQAWISHLKNKE